MSVNGGTETFIKTLHQLNWIDSINHQFTTHSCSLLNHLASYLEESEFPVGHHGYRWRFGTRLKSQLKEKSNPSVAGRADRHVLTGLPWDYSQSPRPTISSSCNQGCPCDISSQRTLQVDPRPFLISLNILIQFYIEVYCLNHSSFLSVLLICLCLFIFLNVSACLLLKYISVTILHHLSKECL